MTDGMGRCLNHRCVYTRRTLKHHEHASFCFQAILVAFPRFLLIRFDDNHLAAEIRQLHLHMARVGYYVQPIQRRSAQQDVVGGVGIYDQVPDAFGASPSVNVVLNSK